MKFKIAFTPEAINDMRLFKKYDCSKIINGIEQQLEYQPLLETQNRKVLRPNKIAEWELRIDKFRVFYDVDRNEQCIKIVAVGFKSGNKLFIRGEEYTL